MQHHARVHAASYQVHNHPDQHNHPEDSHGRERLLRHLYPATARGRPRFKHIRALIRVRADETQRKQRIQGLAVAQERYDRILPPDLADRLLGGPLVLVIVTISANDLPQAQILDFV